LVAPDSGQSTSTSIDLRCSDLKEYDLSGKDKLEVANLAYNKLTILNTSNNFELKRLCADHNNLEAFDGSSNSKLESIDLSDNRSLHTLNLLNNPKLTYINISYTSLSTPPQFHPEVEKGIKERTVTLIDDRCPYKNSDTFINLSYSDLKEYDLSGKDKLKVANLAHNNLTILNTSNNFELKRLCANLNNIKVFDGSDNLGLETIDLSWNKPLEKLDLSKNPKLTYINISYTSLSTPPQFHPEVEKGIKEGTVTLIDDKCPYKNK
jgi:uncharacterized protein YjbI with pentapeptide repeats